MTAPTFLIPKVLRISTPAVGIVISCLPGASLTTRSKISRSDELHVFKAGKKLPLIGGVVSEETHGLQLQYFLLNPQR